MALICLHNVLSAAESIFFFLQFQEISRAGLHRIVTSDYVTRVLYRVTYAAQVTSLIANVFLVFFLSYITIFWLSK